MRRVQIVLLCEDLQHATFCSRFLKEMGKTYRVVRVLVAPGGEGSAEQYVRRNFPKELRAHRAQHVDGALIVMTDGDLYGVSGRMQQLDEECQAKDIPVRSNTDRVAVFVPSWNIEAWLAYLDGETVDEAQANYPKFQRQRECQRHVNALVEMCRSGRLREPQPPSLTRAGGEYSERIRDWNP